MTIDHAPAAPEPPSYLVNCAAEHCTLRVRAHAALSEKLAPGESEQS
jgi:hypothetical protein